MEKNGLVKRTRKGSPSFLDLCCRFSVFTVLAVLVVVDPFDAVLTSTILSRCRRCSMTSPFVVEARTDDGGDGPCRELAPLPRDSSPDMDAASTHTEDGED